MRQLSTTASTISSRRERYVPNGDSQGIRYGSSPRVISPAAAFMEYPAAKNTKPELFGWTFPVENIQVKSQTNRHGLALHLFLIQISRQN
ncbi:MAG TPA: hypothetical protein VLH15_03970 [Dehalococcoidales bacterium]|nr:hypothetical protein [Dehalococcoidales bacterium]